MGKRKEDILSSKLCSHQARVVHRHTCEQKTHTHRTIIYYNIVTMTMRKVRVVSSNVLVDGRHFRSLFLLHTGEE